MLGTIIGQLTELATTTGDHNISPKIGGPAPDRILAAPSKKGRAPVGACWAVFTSISTIMLRAAHHNLLCEQHHQTTIPMGPATA